MLVNSKAGGRNGFIVYVLVLVGCQPSLFEKIEAFRKGVVGSSNKEEVVETPVLETTEEKTKTEETAGATSIDNLPKA